MSSRSFRRKVNKSTRGAVSEPEVVATGSGWVKTSLRKQVFLVTRDPVATAPGSDTVRRRALFVQGGFGLVRVISWVVGFGEDFDRTDVNPVHGVIGR